MNLDGALGRVRVVLSRTSHPGNIGAAARAMKTMGLSQLVLVDPQSFPDPVATARAAGADDILASARQLWQQGKPRHALALLYRASVEELGKRADVALPPGSTEAQCLRASRRMPQEADRALFARMVRTWQYAAYAGRLPTQDDFDALTDALHRHYGWPA